MSHILRKLTLVVTFTVGLAVVLVESGQISRAQNSAACQPAFNLAVPTTIPAAAVPVSLSAATSSTKTVADVMFTIDSAILGRGVQVGANTQWQMQWYAQYSNPGNHTIGAQLNFTDGSSCSVPPIPTNIASTTMPGIQLVVNAAPAIYNGLTNQVVNFTLKAGISSATATAVDITQYAYFQKKPITLGSLTPFDGTPAIRYSTGPVSGGGTIGVDVSYGGLKQTLNIPISVQGAPNVTSGTNSDPGSGTSSNTNNTPGSAPKTTTPGAGGVTDTTTAAASAASIEAEPVVKDCVLSKLGQARFEAIRSGLSRPTATEFESINKCFETRNYVLPSGFVPISPTEVKNQPVGKEVAIEKPTNDILGKTTKLKFNGKSKPNTVVLLYVYSEPMVLSTTSDSSGNWSYALEDPLQPGNHEVYAVVDKGDGTYERSQPIGFAIASAESSTANPNGYSLKLGTITATAKDKNKSLLIYGVGIVVLVVLMLGIGFGVIMKRRKKPVTMETPQTVAPTTAPINTGAVAEPVETTSQAVPTEPATHPETSPTPKPNVANPSVDQTVTSDADQKHEP